MLSEIERYPRASVQVGKKQVINDILHTLTLAFIDGFQGYRECHRV